MVPIIYYGVYHLCCILLLLMIDTLGPSAMISDLNTIYFHEYICVVDPIYKLYAPVIVRNRRSQCWQLGTSKGMDYNLRITCIHRLLMLCSGALWQEHLNLHKFLLAPLIAGLHVSIDCCASFYGKHAQLPLGYMPNVWYMPRWSLLFCEPCPVLNLLHVISRPCSAQSSIP